MSDGEQCAWAILGSVADVATAIPWATPAWMYLERAPQRYLNPQAAANALRFEPLDSDVSFDEWERGRIFDVRQELRWELSEGEFHIVYCGDAPPAALDELMLELVGTREPAYFLWGQQVQPQDRPTLRLGRAESAFVELRIPRVLRYPVPASTRRVRVKLRELLGPDGALCYARWTGVIEEAQ